jgi:hypothetical protein
MKAPRSSLPFVVTFFVMLASMGVFLILPRYGNAKFLTTSEDTSRKNSNQELLRFWNQHVGGMLINELPKGGCPEPAITERYKILQGKILGRYGREPHVSIVSFYSRAATNVNAGSFIETNGMPMVRFHLPALRNVFDDYVSNGITNGYNKFQISMLVAYMHELEHLGNGLIGDPANDTFKQRVYRERMTWAYTCQYSIAPLMRDFPDFVDENSKGFYRHWMEAGENAESPLWIHFIEDCHQAVKKVYGQNGAK